MTYFLDTDVCIFYLKGEKLVIEGLYKLPPDKVKIPAVVQAELIEGGLAAAHPKRSL